MGGGDLNAWITIISMDIRVVVTVLTRSMIDSRLNRCRVDIYLILTCLRCVLFSVYSDKLLTDAGMLLLAGAESVSLLSGLLTPYPATCIPPEAAM